MLIFAVKCAGNTDGECGSEDSVLFQASGGKARTSRKSPVGTVKTFIKAMGDGDADIIISLFVSTGQNMWQGIPTNLGTDKIKTFLH